MKLKKENTHRILISDDDEIVVNMVYVEASDEVDDIFGSFSGSAGAGGYFHQKDGETVVSDDPSEFVTNFSQDEIQNFCQSLDRLRAELEELDDEGNMLELSEKGFEFSYSGEEGEDGLLHSYSESASDDFIYDCQEDWNLNFGLE